jgi:hypothetical protein
MPLNSRRLIAKTLIALAGVAMLTGGLATAQAQDVKKAKLGHSFNDAHWHSPKSLDISHSAV